MHLLLLGDDVQPPEHCCCWQRVWQSPAGQTAGLAAAGGCEEAGGSCQPPTVPHHSDLVIFLADTWTLQPEFSFYS